MAAPADVALATLQASKQEAKTQIAEADAKKLHAEQEARTALIDLAKESGFDAVARALPHLRKKSFV